MNKPRQRRVWCWVVIGAGGMCALAGLPFLLGGLMGVMGVLADVGPDENLKMGVAGLKIASLPLALGGALLTIGVVRLRLLGRPQSVRVEA